MIVDLKCPTCISLAILGDEKSTKTFNFFCNVGGLTPSSNTEDTALRTYALFKNIFMKPGPAMSRLAMISWGATFSMILLLISLGGTFLPIKKLVL